MPAIDKLLKYLNEGNVVKYLDDEQKQTIVQDVITGFEIDEESRRQWLETNLEAMKIIKHAEDKDSKDRQGPFEGCAKVIYPLLANAVIQLASRLTPHVVRNNRVGEIAVLGQDMPMQGPQGQAVPGMYIKQDKAKKVSDYLNYSYLIKSKTWLKDTHKLLQILAGWGTAFRQVYYDPVFGEICDDLIPPENVVINHKISCLEKAKRITIIHSLTKNEIIEKIRAEVFDEVDLDKLDTQTDKENEEEINPSYEILCQFTYLDLDEDGYKEPYYVYINKELQQVYSIYPAYELDDIKINDTNGSIKYIKPRINLVDFHLIDDPQGGFYSIGLNYLLLHPNKSITAVLRQLLDAGAYANSPSGWRTTRLKPDEMNIDLAPGEFTCFEADPTIDPSKHMGVWPFKEPSQVLFSLLQLLIESTKETGFITDLLVGEASGQNVPATTMLAMIEQGTRAFKPVVEKLFLSLKNEFTIWFHLNSLYLDEKEYVKFQDSIFEISKEDFNEKDLDIAPVANPTLSSEAHKYAKDRFLIELLQNVPDVINKEAIIMTIFKDLEYPSPEQFISPPQPQPDPKLMKVQLEAQMAPLKLEIEQLKQMTMLMDIKLKEREMGIKEAELGIKHNESKINVGKVLVDSHKDLMKLSQDQQKIDIDRHLMNTEEKFADAAMINARSKGTK